MYFQFFLDYLPLEKGGAFHLNKIESPLAKDAYAAFGWNLPNGSGDENEKVKSLRKRQRWRQQRRRTTDTFWSEKLTWAFGTDELKRWNSSKYNQAQICYNLRRRTTKAIKMYQIFVFLFRI